MTLLSIPEVCQRLSVSRSTIYRVIRSGEIATYKVGSRIRVAETDLDKFIQKAKTANPRVLAANYLLTR